jgi:hypothetical protein
MITFRPLLIVFLPRLFFILLLLLFAKNKSGGDLFLKVIGLISLLFYILLWVYLILVKINKKRDYFIPLIIMVLTEIFLYFYIV